MHFLEYINLHAYRKSCERSINWEIYHGSYISNRLTNITLHRNELLRIPTSVPVHCINYINLKSQILTDNGHVGWF